MQDWRPAVVLVGRATQTRPAIFFEDTRHARARQLSTEPTTLSRKGQERARKLDLLGLEKKVTRHPHRALEIKSWAKAFASEQDNTTRVPQRLPPPGGFAAMGSKPAPPSERLCERRGLY
eukprot:360685-Chlamydomonas_euryale.AAC.9